MIDYLALTGRSLPAGVLPAVARQWGAMYVGQFESRFKGVAVDLPDPFPRDIYNPTPISVEYAVYEAGLAWADGVELFGQGGTTGGQVIEESVDVLRVRYAGPQAGSSYYDDNLFIYPPAYYLLLPFFKSKWGASAFVVGPC